MREKVWTTYEFADEAKKIFSAAEVIAEKLDSEKLLCSHVFAACVHVAPEIVHKILGRAVTRLPDKFELTAAELSCLPPDPGAEGMAFDVELGVVFIDDGRDSAFGLIRDYLPGRPVGAAEIVFAILKEPAEEISDILLENGFPNDAVLLDRLVTDNYLTHIWEFSEGSSRERLAAAVAAGERFEKIMCGALCGQRKAIEETASALTEFWRSGKNGEPLVLLLLSKAGGGRSFFAGRMQTAFVELGMQTQVEIPLDMSGFLHDSSCEVDLLGESRAFINAKCGKLYTAVRNNRRGMLVFEDILTGTPNAKNILRSLACNLAYDKYHEETLRLPFNVLVFTMKLSDDQYDFLRKKSAKGIDAKLLNELFRAGDDSEGDPAAGRSAAGSAPLWQRADKIILLEQLTGGELEELAAKRLDETAKRLGADYGVELECNDRKRFFRMLIESEPHELGPGELLDHMREAFAGSWKILNRTPGIRRMRISCAELPEYRYEPERRIVRGDFLAHSRREVLGGECLELVFDGFRYARQDRVDCGKYRIERPRETSFDDIVGLDAVRDELLEALHYMTHRDEYASDVPAPCLGYILYGPPGTGKTSLIAALAKHADLPVFAAPCSIFSDARELRAMFQRAAAMAPAIVVLDEFNSIGDSTMRWKRDAINELLAFMDGAQKQSRLLVLASTNHLEQIEEAFLRWGRFGRQIRIDLPTAEARDLYVRKFEKKFGLILADEVRHAFVEETERVNFADLKGVLGCALRSSVRTRREMDAETLKTALSRFVGANHGQGIGFFGGGGR